MAPETFFIFHGVFGSPGENWFPWLKERLDERGHRVVVPALPFPERPSLEEWLEAVGRHGKDLEEEPILVGHSLGCALILRILERKEIIARASFLVGGFIGMLGDERFDVPNKTFFKEPFNWRRIKGHCGRFIQFYSDNDPFVPKEKALELSRQINSELVLVKGAGHFNAEAGYTEFPLLLERIESVQSR